MLRICCENLVAAAMDVWNDMCEAAVLHGYPMFYSVNLGTTLGQVGGGLYKYIVFHSIYIYISRICSSIIRETSILTIVIREIVKISLIEENTLSS